MAQPGRVTGDLVGTPKGKAQAVPQEHEEERVQATIAPSMEERPGAPLRQGKVALNFRLDPEMHRQLRNASHLTDTSIQQIVETAVRRYLDTMAL